MKYVFRGNVVFNYDETKNKLTTGKYIHNTDLPIINICKFIDDDFILMEQFFKNINDYKKDNTVELKDIVVD